MEKIVGFNNVVHSQDKKATDVDNAVGQHQHRQQQESADQYEHGHVRFVLQCIKETLHENGLSSHCSSRGMGTTSIVTSFLPANW
jgi:hypothetical protein